MRICKRLSLFHYNVTYVNMYWQEQSGLFKIIQLKSVLYTVQNNILIHDQFTR